MKRLGVLFLFLGLAAATPMLSVILKEGSEFEDTQSKRAVQVPYISKEKAEKIERAVSEAWNRYDARVFYRLNAALHGQAACKEQTDDTLGVWDNDKNKKLAKDEFCDGDIPTNPVPWYPLACPSFYLDVQELVTRYAKVMLHANTVYLRDYLEEINKALEKEAPKTLLWMDYRIPGSGAAFIPVEDANAQGRWEELVQKGLGIKSFARTYYEQAKPGQIQTRQELGRQTNQGGYEPPGIQALEEAKKKVVARGSVHPSGKNHYWAGKNQGPKPQGEAGLASKNDYEIYGLLPVLKLKSNLVSETSPRSLTFTVSCITQVGVPVPIPIPIPVIKVGAQVNTYWEGLIEGYKVEDAVGFPRLLKP